MIIIRFSDSKLEHQALGCLIANGISGKSWANGETTVSEEGLKLLEERGIEFEVLARLSS